MILVFTLYNLIAFIFQNLKSTTTYEKKILIIMPPIRDMEIGIISGVIILKVIDQNYQEINGISLSIEIHNLLVQNKNGEINCDFKYMSQYLWT